MIKITEETKIKDIIPEQYEFDSCSGNVNFNSGFPTQYIFLKKKEVKDFNWYVNKYFWDENRFCHILTVSRAGFHDSMKIGKFEYVPFEFKIGLLKFICDDLKISWKEFIDNRDKIHQTVGCGKVYIICPKEFINSLFE